jgi:hypothetical protein
MTSTKSFGAQDASRVSRKILCALSGNAGMLSRAFTNSLDSSGTSERMVLHWHRETRITILQQVKSFPVRLR